MAASRPPRTALALASAVPLVLLAAALGADNEVNVQFHTFQDSRGVTVLSPSADLDKDFTDRTGMRLRFGLDAITAASDSCVRCHPDGQNNQRAYLSAGFKRKLNENLKLDVGAEYSQERFYRATTGGVSISRSLNKNNTTIAGGYAISYNQPQLHPSQQWETQWQQSAYLALTHNVTKNTALQLGYQLDHLTGYLANPFLRADVNGIRQVGVTPDVRTRQSVTARIRQALPAQTYLDADYRHYFDSWSLSSDTWYLGLSHHFSHALLAALAYRHYGQTGAYFYQPSYTGSPEFYTADFRLAPFASNQYSGRFEIQPHDGLLFLKPDSALLFQADFYRADSGFQANIFSLGVRVPLK